MMAVVFKKVGVETHSHVAVVESRRPRYELLVMALIATLDKVFEAVNRERGLHHHLNGTEQLFLLWHRFSRRADKPGKVYARATRHAEAYRRSSSRARVGGGLWLA